MAIAVAVRFTGDNRGASDGMAILNVIAQAYFVAASRVLQVEEIGRYCQVYLCRVVYNVQFYKLFQRRFSMRPSGWARWFDEPIPLPKGKPLVTLRDAALYTTKLPERPFQFSGSCVETFWLVSRLLTHVKLP
jgi:hypothetical protein